MRGREKWEEGRGEEEKDKGEEGRKLSWSHRVDWKPEQKDPQCISFLPATIQAPGASGGDSELAAPTFVPERGSHGRSKEESAQ